MEIPLTILKLDLIFINTLPNCLKQGLIYMKSVEKQNNQSDQINFSMGNTFFLFLCLALPCAVICSHEEISRNQFPEGFMFGASTSAYQIEGAVVEDGRGLNNWDLFGHVKGNIEDGETADVAADHYHRFRDDIELIKSLGLNAYRFSISWPRILPRGRFGDINPNGIAFYNKLIDNLILKGIEPIVTLSHHEFPLELEERYKSWLSPQIHDDFAYYADICFKNFGDRVKYWVTINEPILFVRFAYMMGIYPPRRCSAPFGNCSEGNSEIEPLLVIHNMILSHSKAVDIYRKHYQPEQKGQIGIVVAAVMYEPLNDNAMDNDAVNRALAFNVPWVLDPIILGDYPPEMRKVLGDQLPYFTPEESNRLKDGLDFIGVNHYSSLYAKDCIQTPCASNGNHAIEAYVYLVGRRNGVPIGEPTAMQGLYVVPNGMGKVIRYLKKRYNNKPMIVTENGYPQAGQPSNKEDNLLNDVKRVDFHKKYLASLAHAIKDGADVRGYFVWSLMDNFEWTSGYSLRFGLYHVDFRTLERTPKLSAKWYKNFLTNGTYSDEHQPRIMKGTMSSSKVNDVLVLEANM